MLKGRRKLARTISCGNRSISVMLDCSITGSLQLIACFVKKLQILNINGEVPQG